MNKWLSLFCLGLGFRPSPQDWGQRRCPSLLQPVCVHILSLHWPMAAPGRIPPAPPNLSRILGKPVLLGGSHYLPSPQVGDTVCVHPFPGGHTESHPPSAFWGPYRALNWGASCPVCKFRQKCHFMPTEAGAAASVCQLDGYPVSPWVLFC